LILICGNLFLCISHPTCPKWFALLNFLCGNNAEPHRHFFLWAIAVHRHPVHRHPAHRYSRYRESSLLSRSVLAAAQFMHRINQHRHRLDWRKLRDAVAQVEDMTDTGFVHAEGIERLADFGPDLVRIGE
jgi:hypothetical protein